MEAVPGAELERGGGCQWVAALAEAEGRILRGTVPQSKNNDEQHKKKIVLEKERGKEEGLSPQTRMRISIALAIAHTETVRTALCGLRTSDSKPKIKNSMQVISITYSFLVC